MIIFKKELSYTERKRHWINVPRECLSDLPHQGEVFKINVGQRQINVKVDKCERLLGLGNLVFDDLNLEKPNSTAVLEKTPKGEYVLTNTSEKA